VGTALAKSLAGRFGRIALIEAGNAAHSVEANLKYFKAEQVADERHPPTELYRRRMLGGTTSVWGGRCIPLDREDLEPAFDRAGWPISFEAVEPYYPAALEFLDAGAPDFSARSALPQLGLPAGLGESGVDDSLIIVDRIERFSKPTNVWRKWQAELAQSADIEVIHDTACTAIATSHDGNRVVGLDLKSASGNTHRINATTIILACGGLETPRLLLASRGSRSCGLGNEQDLVGRYYMTHLIGIAGHMRFKSAATARAFDYGMTPDHIYGRRLLLLTPEHRRRNDIGNIVFRPTIPSIAGSEHGDPVLSAMFLAKRFIIKEYALRLANENFNGNFSVFSHAMNVLRGLPKLSSFSLDWTRRRIAATRKLPSVFLYRKDGTYPLEFNSEQRPNPDSRIFLGNETDPNGVPRLSVQWRMQDDESTGISRAYQLLADGFAKSGLGDVQLGPDFEATVRETILPQGGHHIGTARMGTEPGNSVVDSFGEVWGTRGLYVAGAALFPTSGFANPTLAAVALAYRLAERLLQRHAAPLAKA
jgi:choline dehydrogenase-like flavoprotein